MNNFWRKKRSYISNIIFYQIYFILRILDFLIITNKVSSASYFSQTPWGGLLYPIPFSAILSFSMGDTYYKLLGKRERFFIQIFMTTDLIINYELYMDFSTLYRWIGNSVQIILMNSNDLCIASTFTILTKM